MNTDNKIPEDISILIIEFLEGSIGKEGLSILNRWLQEDSNHLFQFNSLKSVWLMSGKAAEFTTGKINQDLSAVKSDISKRSKPEMKPFWSFGKIAASWIIFLVTGGMIGLFMSGHNHTGEKPTITTITAPLGAKSIVDLPDGTKVWINAGSKLTYGSNYGRLNREVKLVGEAYFSVRKNPAIPFIVKTSDIVVKALGTKFNVKAYPEERTITTTLEEGKIQVFSLHKKSQDKIVELKPREMITFIKKSDYIPDKEKASEPSYEPLSEGGTMTGIIPEVKTELQTSWKENIWIIEGQPLGELAPLLERRFNVIISFDKNEIKDFKFTGKIQNETIEQILTALELSSPVKFNLQNNHISISMNNAMLEKYSKNTNH